MPLILIPVFNASDAELFFIQLEENFEAAGITSEASRLKYLRSALDQAYADKIMDILASPPTERPYTAAKTELLNQLYVSEESKKRQLLQKQTLGDRRPSEFLQHLKDLAGVRGSNKLIRTIWMSRLPVAVQALLATQEHETTAMAAKNADLILDMLRITEPSPAFCASSQEMTPQLAERRSTATRDPAPGQNLIEITLAEFGALRVGPMGSQRYARRQRRR